MIRVPSSLLFFVGPFVDSSVDLNKNSERELSLSSFIFDRLVGDARTRTRDVFIFLSLLNR